MKRLSLLLLLCTVVALAQEPPAAPPAAPQTNVAERAQAPTYSDQYCAGFISKEAFSRGSYIMGGLNSPNQTQFAQRDIVFLDGSGYQVGAPYSVIRELHDPNRQPAFTGQAAAVAEVGAPYAELGRVRVTAMRGNTAIAEVEFSCSAIVPGDLVVPFQEKPPLNYRSGAAAFDRFPSDTGSTVARIVMAKEFDFIVGAGHKVYVSAGADKGVKVGDYFRVVRGYDPAKIEKVEALSYKVKQSEDTQKNKLTISNARYGELPKRAIGEMIVLTVTPTASTAMVTLSLESINVGDTVELVGSAKQ